jgi:hypothetical protein
VTTSMSRELATKRPAQVVAVRSDKAVAVATTTRPTSKPARRDARNLFSLLLLLIAVLLLAGGLLSMVTVGG